jgi:hypothetical protein
MANQLYPSLKDIAPSWADIAVTSTIYDGPLLEMADISAINWSRTVEVGEKRGASGGRVMARTTGSLSQEASMTLYKSGYLRFIGALKDVAPSRGNQKLISLVVFDVMIEYTPPGSDDIFRTKIKGCRLLGDSADAAEGTDASVVELTLSPIEIVNIVDGEEVALI